MPIITAPKNPESTFRQTVKKLKPRTIRKFEVLTDGNPDGYVPATTEITDENDRDDISDLVRAGNEAGQTRRDLKPLFDGGDNGVDVTRT